MDPLDALLGPVIIIAADIIAYSLFRRLGGETSGRGVKYQPFSGGEESIPTRGLYQSDLFVFASLFMVVEAFALLLAGSFLATSNYYPVLFLLGGGGVVTLVVWWFMIEGGGEF
jgi:hypothetical protein